MGLVITEQDFEEFAQRFREHKGPFVLDVETTGTDLFRNDQIIGYAFYLPTCGSSYYLPVRHSPMPITCVGWEWEGYETAKLKRLKHRERLCAIDVHYADPNWASGPMADDLQDLIFSRKDVAWLNWNVAGFDCLAIEQEGIEVRCPIYDVMYAAHLADENQPSYQLDFHGKLRVGDSKLEDALDAWAKANKIRGSVKGHLKDAPLWLVADYAMQDCRLTWKLAEGYIDCLKEEKLDAHPGKTLYNIWLEIGGDYARAIGRMTTNGLRVDREKAAESANLAEQKVEELYRAMAKMAGQEFNPRSNPQMGKLLGLPSVNKDMLAYSHHPMIPLLEEYRQWEKAVRTYYRPWLDMADERGYLHPSLQVLTVTGRLACRSPNLQNLPRASDIYDVRRSIIAPEGHVLIEADLSNAEMRIITHYCMDPAWVEALTTPGGDIHQSTSDQIGLTERYGAKEGRQVAKIVNFGTLYGMGKDKLAYMLNQGGISTTTEEAEGILYDLRGSKPRLTRFNKDLQTFARKNRYIEMWTGRRRHYPYDSPHARKGKEDETHTALNTIVQGGVAELLRRIITDLDVAFEHERSCGREAPRMHLQVHDSVLFSMRPCMVARWLPPIRRVMQESYRFNIPMLADFKIGDTWATLQKMEA